MAGSDMTTPSRRTLVFLVVVLVTLTAAWLVMRVAPSEDVNASSGRADARDVVQQYPVGDRPDVGPFEVTMLDGSKLSDTDLRGTATVLNVWGSWCGPCRAEAPELVDAAERLGPEAQFFGINVRDSPDAARAFERAFEIPYPSVRPDDSAAALLAFGGVLSAVAVPTTVVVDANGKVAARIVGQTDASTLVGLVEDASTNP
ncbi:TlpA family protein disulfide reductase [Nocardioides glacieisoli]|uniref:TlpA family protein disulfide reductase n=2 Tax=Nocardioides glacieisoli TaxID=1168730 RepID=A0A4Q2RL83_9ACTN|nr:TlpA family protein disulfide reductase [Nocardioides glacieisoli]